MSSTLRSSDGRVIVPARLRRRRVEVRRDQGRRRLRRLVTFGALALIVAGGWALLRSPLLAVDEVTVSGSAHVDRAEVVTAGGLGPGTAMMDVSPGRVETRLEALPWIARAKVSRQWPNHVEVTLVDRKPVAQVAAGESFALVDDSGRVLQTLSGRAADLPLLEGLHAAEPGDRIASAAPLLQTAAALPPFYRKQIAGIGSSHEGSVTLTLADGGVVDLGSSDDFAAKFASLSAVLDHLGSLGAGCRVDVSVPTSPTLEPEYGCA